MPSTAFPSRLLGNGKTAATGTIVRAKAPLRVTFAGGGTDFPDYYETFGGAVFSSTINRYAYVNVHPRDDSEILIRSLDLGYMVKYNANEQPIYDGVLDLIKATIQRLGVPCGIDINVRTDAPPGSGLGGSSAMTAAVIGALCALNGTPRSLHELAELNYTIEREDLHIAGGKQDQYDTTFGGLMLTEFSKEKTVVNTLRVDREILNDLESHLLLCYTGMVRADLGLIDRQVAFFREGREETLAGLHRVHQMAYEMKDALLAAHLDDFGALLHESYMNKKRINPQIADGTPTDMLYEMARQKGAVGGKLLGAGGGGYLLLYCHTDQMQDVRRALEAQGGQFTDFAFDGLGLQVWRSSCP